MGRNNMRTLNHSGLHRQLHRGLLLRARVQPFDGRFRREAGGVPRLHDRPRPRQRPPRPRLGQLQPRRRQRSRHGHSSLPGQCLHYPLGCMTSALGHKVDAQSAFILHRLSLCLTMDGAAFARISYLACSLIHFFKYKFQSVRNTALFKQINK